MKRRVLFIFLAAFSALLFADPVRAADTLVRPQSGNEAVIREIKIEVRDIFNENDLGVFYRGVNAVKVSTNESIVRQELLFKEGDVYNEFVIQESERSLRRIPYLRKISITPLFDGGAVDILVSVQDTWTLFPFISFTSGGGTNKQSAGIAETNLLGYGKRLELLYADDEGREKIEGVWDDRRLFGTYQQLTLGVFDRSDGYRTVGFYGRPFRSLVEPYAWNVDTDFFDLVGRLFDEGDESFIYREKHEAVTAGATLAYGDPTSRVNRFSFGYDYLSARFQEATDQDFDDADVDPDSVSRDPALLPDNRQFSGPFVALQSISPEFVAMNFLDRFDRVEDFNLGNEFYGRMTFAAEAFGSTKDTLLFNISDADGYRFSPTAFGRGKLSITNRVDTESVNNTVVQADLRYYNVFGAKYWGRTYLGKYTLVGSLSIDFADRLDKDKQLLLGASNGLRGYEDRAFDGDQQILLNLEQRVHLIEDLYKLISVGGAAFVDVGGASYNGLGDVLTDELRSDVGIGLRLGFPRSSGGSVIRIDLALPLRDGAETMELEPRILFTTGQAVNARLPNDTQQSEGSNVTVKFLP